jgi:hypothetical protein
MRYTAAIPSSKIVTKAYWGQCCGTVAVPTAATWVGFSGAGVVAVVLLGAGVGFAVLAEAKV